MADETFPEFVEGAPEATTPLTGTELAVVIQDGASKQTPVSSFPGSPGGSSGEFQFNNSSTFGGAANFSYVNGGLNLTATNPSANNDLTNAPGFIANITFNELVNNIGFTDQAGGEVNLFYDYGLNLYNGGTNAKSTVIGLSSTVTATGAGEKYAFEPSIFNYGNGDTFLMSGQLFYVNGPIAGDEGTGFSTQEMTLSQPNNLQLANITSVTRTEFSTTITANVTASQNPQNIPVASLTGANVDDWIILNQQAATAEPNSAEAQILSIDSGAGTINCICPCNLTSGMTITPALVLGVDGTYQFGQQRVVVNLQGEEYSTGTASQNGTGALIGTGTDWTTGMVGGSATNVGVISFDADTFAGGGVFDGGYSIPLSQNSSLRTWYQITSVDSTTEVGILSNSAAGAGNYNGYAPVYPESGNYIIKSAAKIMRLYGSNLICETSTATWSVDDQIECIFCAYPDVHGWTWGVAQWNAGGTRRDFLDLNNIGARMFDSAVSIGWFESETGYGNADLLAYEYGISMSAVKTGIIIETSEGIPTEQAIQIAYDDVTPNDASGKIEWNYSTYIQPNTANYGLDIQGVGSGYGGKLSFISNSLNEDTHQSELAFTGYLGLFTSHAPYPPYIRVHVSASEAADVAPTGETFDIAGYGPYSPVTGNQALHFYGYDSDSNQYIQFAVGQPQTSWSAEFPGAGQGSVGVSASDTTNKPSNSFVQQASVWTGSAAATHRAQTVVIPAQGENNAQLTWYVALDYPGAYDGPYSPLQPNFAFGVREDGLITFGTNPRGEGTLTAPISLDAITHLTAPRTVTFMDASGTAMVAIEGTTGAGTALLGTNCPAVTATAPYTWLEMLGPDGSTLYVPAYK